MKKILLCTFAALTLSGCQDFWNREGVGFSGIDGEPRSISEQPGAVGSVARDVNIPAELAVVPTIRVVSEQTALPEMAGVAVENGGRNPNNAVEVTGQNQNLMLSNVQVNSTLFAVLRPADGDSRRVDSNLGASFGNRIEQLTGCLPAGDVYRQGRRNRTAGFAVPLNCS